MKTELIIASGNKHKIQEVKLRLPAWISLVSMADKGIVEDIPETGSTLEENALIKARYVHQKLNCNCFSDDSGLIVDALNGAPGVYSARYAGPDASFSDNNQKLLNALKGETNRTAQFKTVIALVWNNRELLFEGSIAGNISEQPLGKDGFGYDPIFVPQGRSQSFAQMTAEQKNDISHRSIAVAKLVDFLKGQG